MVTSVAVICQPSRLTAGASFVATAREGFAVRLLPFDSRLAAFGGQTLAQGGGQQRQAPADQKSRLIIRHCILAVAWLSV